MSVQSLMESTPSKFLKAEVEVEQKQSRGECVTRGEQGVSCEKALQVFDG